MAETTTAILLLLALRGAVQACPVDRNAFSALDAEAFVESIRYDYSPEGDLVTATDVLGRAMRMAYERHLMVKETKRSGLAFHFAYEGRGNDARCIATWGDGGIHRRESLCGTKNHTILLARRDPLNRVSRFEWKSESELMGQTGRVSASFSQVKRMVGFTDPAGGQTALEYDRQGLLVGMRMPNGAQTRWRYDRLGRCVEVVDPKGNRERREFDLAGRILRVDVPDGNVRKLSYDAEGNVLAVKDQHYDVKFAYQGMGRLASRTQEGTTVAFEYDTEESLVAIHNEAGAVYRFTLDKAGNVKEESGFDGLLRKYGRDKTGRVLKVERPDDRATEYEYDAGGRVVAVKYSDGTSESYAYRPDGGLIESSNVTATVKFERDALGRIVKEVQGADSVESAFDLLGLRSRMKTSKGHVLQIERNLVGDVVGMKAGGGPVAPSGETTAQAPLPPWEARFTRDQLGLEVERTLPGGVRARWERDSVGRPLKHEIWSGGTVVSAQAYTWEPNDRLKMIVDALKGPVQYRHDGLGNLIGAAYADDKFDLRMPDAVGNLFKTVNKKDRKYGPAGQLLESKGSGGITKYEYDPEGNLAKKLLPDGKAWTYAWNGAGMLTKVVRPDGKTVEFGYDALGRRVWKKYGTKTTKWMWDGNVPVHEWVEVDPESAMEPAPEQVSEAEDAGLRQRAADLAKRTPQGPPTSASLAPRSGERGAPITWVFEPESFAPLAKLSATERFGIVTDHLGTPTTMLDERGGAVWSADIGVYGELRNVVGDKQACPFRWPGQYEDEETGLYYNRFRYYDPEAGEYVSQDPIGLLGGLRPHKYAHDPVVWFDPLGLTCKGEDDEDKPHALWSGEGSMQAAQEWAEKNGGVTLEMTARGDRAARHAKGLDDWEMARPVWAKESRRYAKEASGDVHVFVTAAARNNPNSVLNSVELPTLARNPKVTNIIFHDVQ